MTTETPKAKLAMNAADVRAAIQSHFGSGGEQYAVLFEVRNGTAWRANRSVDAVVMSLWPSLGMELWGMEIKISRGDWRREMDHPAKASEVFDYFDRWFLVAPENVATHDELPQPWGWFVPTVDGLRKVRDAAKNPNVKAVDRHFLGALLRRVAKTDDAFTEAAIRSALESQRQVYDADVEKRVLERMGDMRKDAEQWAKLRSLLKKKPDDWVYTEDVVGAINIIMKSGLCHAYGGLHSLIAEVDRMKERLGTIADELNVRMPKKGALR